MIAVDHQTANSPIRVELPQPMLFGHPRGLANLIVAEGAAYFAYTGVQALLTLYLARHAFAPGHIDNILGIAGYRGILEAIFGPLTRLSLASQTFGLFTGCMYALPLLGALIADRWLGQNRSIAIGASLLGLGYALLVSEATLLIGLGLACLGNGMLKTNLLGQIGRLYDAGDERSTRGFGAYQIAVSSGAFLSPLVCGGLAQWVSWQAAFAAPSIASVIVLVAYFSGLPYLPADTLRKTRDGSAAPIPLRPRDTRTIAVLITLLTFDVVLFGAYNQSFNIFPVFAQDHVDLRLFGRPVPASWFTSIDGLFTIIVTALSMRLWGTLAKRGREPRALTKITIGLACGALGFCVLAAGSNINGEMLMAYALCYFALLDTAAVWVDLVVLSQISRLAPPAIASVMLGMYLMTTMISNLLVGWLGTLYEGMPPHSFWLIHALVIASLLPVILLAGGWLQRGLAAASEPAAAA